MTTISIDQLRDHLDEYLEEAARGEVIVTHDGKPWVVLQAVSGMVDGGSDSFAPSPEFWDMIRERRQEQGIPWDQAKSQLDLP